MVVVSATAVLVFARSDQGLDSAPNRVVLAALAIATVLMIALLWRTRLTLDPSGIAYQSLWSRVRLAWAEVDDFQCSPRLVWVASTKTRKRIRAFRGEYGMSLEPFDKLQAEIDRQVGERLDRASGGIQLPMRLEYPGLGVGTGLIYVIPMLFVLWYAILLAISSPGAWPGTLAFSLVACLVLVPFFVRDYRRSHRKILLEDNGLREVNGHETSIAWSAIARITVKEPLGTGYGSIVVEGTDAQKIRIPRAMNHAGHVLRVISSRSNVQEVFGHET